MTQREVTVRCYVRTSVVQDAIEGHLDTLRACEASGTVGDLDVRDWPDRVMVDGERSGGGVIATFEQFTDWAERHGVSVEPPFRVYTSTSLVQDGSWRVLVTPVCCVTLAREGELLGVYPYSTGDTTHTVTDAIAALDTDTLPATPAAPEAAPPDAPASTSEGTDLEGKGE